MIHMMQHWNDTVIHKVSFLPLTLVALPLPFPSKDVLYTYKHDMHSSPTPPSAQQNHIKQQQKEFIGPQGPLG